MPLLSANLVRIASEGNEIEKGDLRDPPFGDQA